MSRQLNSIKFSLSCLTPTLKVLLALLSLTFISFSSTASNFLSGTTKSLEGAQEFLKVDEAFIFQSEIQQDGLKLSWKIAPEYYLYLERFKFKASDASTQLGAPEYSTQGEAKEDPYFGLVHVIHDYVEVFLPIKLADGKSEDEITVTYQGCAEAGLCYPPKNQYLLFTAQEMPAVPSSQQSSDPSGTPLSEQKTLAAETKTINTPEYMASTDLEDASGIFSFIQNSSLPVIIGIFFLLGLGLTFTPCVFPMIPIITSIIAGQQKPTFGKSLALSSAYVVGMALTYAAAGVITGLLGAGANVQAALQNPYILSFFAAVFVILSLAMFGFYELQLPAFLRDRLNNTSQKLHGGHLTSVFFIGALSALIVSPCVSAPLAGALLYISSTADALIGGASLFALGLGMGLPLILIAVTGSSLLPKAGAWMDSVKYLFGVMLLAVAIWLLSRTLSAQVSMILWALLIGISASHMGAFDAAKPGWPRFLKGLGLVFALYAILLIIGAFTGAKDPLKPLEPFTLGAGATTNQAPMTQKVAFKTIYNLDGLASELELAKASGKPALLDFYADWCISCVVMENNVFPLPDIREKLDQFHLIKADVTENSAENQDLLNHFGLFGPPSILFFDLNKDEINHLRIVGEISKNRFSDILTRALAK